MKKWLFFDLGSTLIDESQCQEYRLCHLLQQPNAPGREELESCMRDLAMRNGLPYKDAARIYGLETTSWPHHLEKLYPCVPDILEHLSGKYHIGIIANQNYGTEQRLIEFGIRHYFEVVASSAELGIAKPHAGIFLFAMEQAGCLPTDAYMIGDRLDNDIGPAAKLGMKTIWVRQGLFGLGSTEQSSCKPDLIIENIGQLTDVL